MDARTSIAVVVVVLAATTALGLWLRRRDGQFKPAGPAGPAGRAGPAIATATSAPRTPQAVALTRLGVRPGTPVTLVQFSSAFCAPCRATRVLCAEVADRVPGVEHIDVDAESHLDAVRALEVWRTPTVLVVAADLNVHRRAAGAPTRSQLLSAISELLPSPAPAQTSE